MTKIADVRHLHALLYHQYGFEERALFPLHHFDQGDRGIYRVDGPDHAPFLLRAYRQERSAAVHLVNSATVLRFLEQAHFPAPRVQQTLEGQLVANHEGWSALLLSHIPGTMSTGTAEEYRLLGALVAQLHSLDVKSAGTVQPPLPPCRWQPTQKIVEWCSVLQHLRFQLPTELLGLCAFSLDTLSKIVNWPPMPTVLLHADPNHFNAIRTAQHELVLIDWDNAGFGPPILDLGYLLLTSHAALPTWPQIDANDVLIAAIMAGYCAIRPLTAAEQQALPIAICLNDALWAAQALSQVIGRDWRENRTLTRFGARYPSLARIGQMAQSKI